MENFKIKLLLTSLLLLHPTVSLAETFSTESFLGLGNPDTKFKSYRPSYFGIRAKHSNNDNVREVKFQLSLKYQLTEDKIIKNQFINSVSNNWFFGYTQKSFWSIQESSEPFRESNFSPEFFKEVKYNDWNSDGALKTIRFGLFQHESTGEADAGSHGWNITYIEPIFKFGIFSMAVKLWVPALFESKKGVAPDNPDIFDFYGHGEFKLFYDQSRIFKHSLMYRQGDNSDRYGARWQTDIALKLGKWRPKVFVQYWSGYGESLKDYNSKTNGLVAGLSAVY